MDPLYVRLTRSCAAFSTGEEVRCVRPDRLENNIYWFCFWGREIDNLIWNYFLLIPLTSHHFLPWKSSFLTISAAVDILLQMTIHHLTEVVVKRVLGNYPLQRRHTSIDRCSPHLEKGARKIYTVVTTEASMWPAGAIWWRKKGPKGLGRKTERVESLTFYPVSLHWISARQKANIFAVCTVKPNR